MVFAQKNNSIISFLLVISIILTPLSLIPKKAEAQAIGGYTSGLGSAIVALPQCQEVAKSGVKKLFSGIGNLFSSGEGSTLISGVDDTIPGLDGAIEVGGGTLKDAAANAANNFDGIQTNNPVLEKNIQDVLKTTTATQKAVESADNNDKCYKSIGRLISKMLIQKLTMSTVNWINSGFNGSPSFIQNPGKFFGDIAKNEVLQFGLEINNPELFPFGKAWMRNTAVAFNNKFQDNARYSLNEMIQSTTPEYSAVTFGQDFSQGGWNAWSAMTQAPANNPLGFKLMADNELQSRLAGTTQSTAEQVHEALQQANGFLGDERCIDAVDGTVNYSITRTQYNEYLAKTPPQKLCSSWEYVTPGKMISDAAGITMAHQNDSYLNVEDLNDAVAAILDATLAQFSSSIMEKGFANIGDAGSDGALVFDNGRTLDSRSRTEKDFMPSQLSSSWLAANPDFNIRTDLTQALIDEQRTYSDKLALQNKELMSTTDGQKYTLSADGKSSNAYGLIPVIYQLDYCIPGPHPGWEEDSRRSLNAAMATIIPETQSSLENSEMSQIADIAGSILPTAGAAAGAAIVVGTGASASLFGVTLGAAAGPIGMAVGALVGTLVGFLFKSGDDGAKVRAYYGVIMQGFTGYLPDIENQDDSRALNLSSKSGIEKVLNTTLDRYATIMNKTYFSSSDILPSVAKEAALNFNQLTGYGQMIKNNEDKIASLKTTVSILGQIKEAVDSLNKKYPEGGKEYENELKTQINTFGRLSASMVNGADIASADNLYKQIVDKKNYIYNNLLKGPYGCEKDLEKTQQPFPSAGQVGESDFDWSNFNVNSVKRMSYPFPILYDYNKLYNFTGTPDPVTFTVASDIPDPWSSGYINKIYANKQNAFLGPGFLSFVNFTTESPSENYNLRRSSERLRIDDLVPQHDDANLRHKAVGNRMNIQDASAGPFETIIGIY